jgi:hypothetical protein
MEDNQAYLRAKRRVRRLRGFYIHLLFYVLVNAFLIVINVAASAARGYGWWAQWPLLGWGIGLAAHGVAVFGIGGWLGADWEERKIKEYLSKP